MEAAQIWRELAPHYFLTDCFGGSSHYFSTDCFGGSSNLEGTGSTLFSGRLFWKFGGNWLHIIFQRIVSEAAQIWRELAPHYFLTDCFGGSSSLVGTGSTLFSDRLSWRQLTFGGNWLYIIFRQIVLEAAQIWRELVPHYFLGDCFGNLEHYFSADCFGGSSNLEGTGSTLFSGGLFWKLEGTASTLFSNRLFWRQLKFVWNWLHIIFRQIVLKTA